MRKRGRGVREEVKEKGCKNMGWELSRLYEFGTGEKGEEGRFSI
jgi:hypothetical protein